jgi:hypothetical protein
MKTGRLLPMLLLALVATAPAVAEEAKVPPAPRERVVLRQTGVRVGSAEVAAPAGPRMRSQSVSAPAAAYSVELSQVARLQGAGAFYRTAVDITNNTNNGGVTARIQYSYSNAACAGGICRTAPLLIPLAAVDNFHQDDMVQYLDSQGLLVAGAVNSAVGTLLITRGRSEPASRNDRLRVPGVPLLRVRARLGGGRGARHDAGRSRQQPAGIAADQPRHPQHRHRRDR